MTEQTAEENNPSFGDERYAFILGALARIDKKVDYLLESAVKDGADDDEFEEEFDI